MTTLSVAGVPARQMHVEHVMGTVVSIDLRGVHARTAGPAVARALEVLHAADATFSTYRADSAISRLDRHELELDDAPADVREVLAACEGLRVATGGRFDARARGRLDPSAYVKGWATQRAAEALLRAGVADFCLAAGGDVVTRGEPSPGEPWRVGVQHPRDRHAVAAVVAARDLAVATSGLYERGAHLVDPRTGRAPGGVLSVTVCGPDLGRADALSTAAFACGEQAATWTLGLPAGYSALTITADERVLSTPGFPRAEASR